MIRHRWYNFVYLCEWLWVTHQEELHLQKLEAKMIVTVDMSLYLVLFQGLQGLLQVDDVVYRPVKEEQKA